MDCVLKLFVDQQQLLLSDTVQAPHLPRSSSLTLPVKHTPMDEHRHTLAFSDSDATIIGLNHKIETVSVDRLCH